MAPAERPVGNGTVYRARFIGFSDAQGSIGAESADVLEAAEALIAGAEGGQTIGIAALMSSGSVPMKRAVGLNMPGKLAERVSERSLPSEIAKRYC